MESEEILGTQFSVHWSTCSSIPGSDFLSAGYSSILIEQVTEDQWDDEFKNKDDRLSAESCLGFLRRLPGIIQPSPSGRRPRRYLFRRNQVHDLSLLLAAICASHATGLSLALGGALFGVGLVLTAWSKLVLRRNTEVVTGGPYALCRHPFYLGNALLDAGLCVMSGYVWLIVLFPMLFYVGYRRTLLSEEALLRRLFGEQHWDFTRTTPMILPLGRRVVRDWRVPLQWGNLLKEHVVSRALRHLAFPLLVILASRLWADPSNIAAPMNLLLLTSAMASITAAAATYFGIEGKTRGRRRARLARTLSRYPAVAWSVLLFAGALYREWEFEEVAEMAPMVLMVLAIQGVMASHSFRRSSLWGLLVPTLMSSLVGMGILMACGAYFLVPIGLCILACQPIRSQTPSCRRPIAQGLLRAASCAALLLAALGVFAVQHTESSAGEALARSAALVTRPQDDVFVLSDDDLEVLRDRLGADWEGGADQLESLIARQAGRPSRLFVLLDEDDMDELLPKSRAALVTVAAAGYGFEGFRILSLRRRGPA
jgi:protein-S-isoprenylcysteine O-methyltransferase Ste14